jgi:hypothetical protein
LGNLTERAGPALKTALDQLKAVASTKGRASIDRETALYYLARSGGDTGRKLLERLESYDDDEHVRKAAKQLLKGGEGAQ